MIAFVPFNTAHLARVWVASSLLLAAMLADCLQLRLPLCVSKTFHLNKRDENGFVLVTVEVRRLISHTLLVVVETSENAREACRPQPH